MNKYFKTLSGILIVTFLVASSFLLFPNITQAAISVDVGNDGTNAGLSATASYSHTVASDATLLVAELLFNNNVSYTSITYNGVAPTGSISHTSNQGLYTYYLFWWFNPSTGANTLTSTLSGIPTFAHVLRSASYKGVAAIAPTTDLTLTTGPTTTFNTDAITPVNPNSWMIGIIENTTASITAGTGTFFRAGSPNGDGIFDSNSAVSVSTALQATASSVSWTAAMAMFSPSGGTNNPSVAIMGKTDIKAAIKI